MSAAATRRETAAERQARHRRVRAANHREVGELEHAESLARTDYEYACARLVLGECEEAAVREAEAELDRTAAALRRARAADAYLSGV